MRSIDHVGTCNVHSVRNSERQGHAPKGMTCHVMWFKEGSSVVVLFSVNFKLHTCDMIYIWMTMQYFDEYLAENGRL